MNASSGQSRPRRLAAADDRHAERAEELDRHHGAEVDAVEREHEEHRHDAGHHAERNRHDEVARAEAGEPRARDGDEDDRGDGEPQPHRADGTDRGEEEHREGRADLHREHRAHGEGPRRGPLDHPRIQPPGPGRTSAAPAPPASNCPNPRFQARETEDSGSYSRTGGEGASGVARPVSW